MRTRDTDLIIRMIDFNLPGTGTNSYMEKQSFIDNVITNPYFNKRLDSGLIKCLLTHQGRDYADQDTSETPYDDLIATHPDLCGVVRDVWIDADAAYASVDLLDPIAFPSAAKLKSLIKKDTYVGVSMATSSDRTSKGNFIINELIGCDFTLDNFFINSGIVSTKKNFSRGVETKNMLNFSTTNDKSIVIHESNLINFSLRDMLREVKKPRYLVLAGRIREVIRTLPMLKSEDIITNKEYIMSYINDLIYNWISITLDTKGKININLGLRLNQYLDSPKVAVDFNQKMNLVKTTYKNQGYMTKINQEKLNEALSSLFNSLWNKICKKAGVDISLFSNDSSIGSELIGR